MSIHSRKVSSSLAVMALTGSLLVAASPVAAAPAVVASDLTSGASVGLIGHANPSAGAFGSAGDGFEIYQRGVSPSIPFSVLDDSLTTFPGDSLGIVDDLNPDRFFGATDTQNSDNAGPVTATWQFDISGASDLELSIDMGAMGDFEASDTFTWSYAIDGGTSSTVFASSVDEAGARTYSLAGGTDVTLNDPMNVGAVQLSNVLQPVSAPLAGTGAVLDLSLTVQTDGGSEAMAFQNIIIMGETGGVGGPAPGDLVINEVIQNPSAVNDSSGEWFEIANVSGAAIDINGWTISDNDSDSHVISNGGPLSVPAGGFVVLGINSTSATNGGVAVDYQYSGIALANGADELVLSDPNQVEYDRIEWDGGAVWPDPTGASMNLDPASMTVAANDDGANWCEATELFGAGDLGTPGATNSVCEEEPPPPLATVFIHEIQGSGPSVAITDAVHVEAIVTSLFTRDDALDGFFIQEEDVDADADPATSEGIFVFCRGNCPANIAVGDLAVVEGTPADFFGMSQIGIGFGQGTVSVTSSGNTLPTAVAIDLPAAGDTEAEATFEATEGMIVTFSDTLAVSEYFELARYGQIVLTETERPYQFTDDNVPSVAGYAAFLADLATRRIILDDDNNDQNDTTSDGPDEDYPYPFGGLSTTNRVRGGDTISDLTGVMHWSFAGQGGTDAWRIRPIDGVDNTFTPANPAPATPDDVGGSLKIASFNVLNYFTTLDLGPGACGPTGIAGCRGANSAAELANQKAKIVSALAELNADVVGLIELENDGDDSSIADLVAGLNDTLGAGTYDYVPTGFIGGDAIKVGYIYKPATVSLVNDFALLDMSVDPTFLDSKNRPALIQTFAQNSTDERVTVAVNHLKSKGSSCDDVGDPGLNDGQANCAGTRTAAAIALAKYLETDPSGSGDPDSLIIGDLNSYALEDPIMALINAGYTDLLDSFVGDDAYTYLFDGQLGYLDYAMANGALLSQVSGTTAWHINGDEVPLFDYNDAIQDPGEASFQRESSVPTLFGPDPLRSSDHDPVLVGLNLDSIPENPTCMGHAATIVGTPGDDVIVGTNKADVIVTFGGNDTILGGNGNDIICSGFGKDTIDGGNGKDLIDAGDGDDVVMGCNAKDVIFGRGGSDELDGGASIDDLDGGDGLDTCVAGENVVACELP